MGKKADFKRMSKCTDTIESLIDYSEDEYLWGNTILDKCQKVFDYIYYIEGNHCWRYRNFKDKWSPFAYQHNFDYREKLSLEDRGIPTVDYNDWMDVGPNLSITHGMFHSTTAKKKHYEACRNNVIFSHVHKSESQSFMSRGHTLKSWSTNCMCELNPEYIKNTDNNWTTGYSTVQMKSDGHFNYHNHDIWDGELILPSGKRLTG